MSSKMSYNSLVEYLPKRESFQNLIAGLPPVIILSYIAAKCANFKTLQRKKGKLSLLPSLSLAERFSRFTTSAHATIYKTSKKSYYVNGRDSDENYSEDDVDPEDYFHAVKNSHINVPKCCVEPYILKGYVLPHKPWRYYLKVLYIPNNETLNVWTHLLPSFYFTWMLYSYHQTIDLLAVWPLLFITTAAIFLTLFSALAHMFHSRSSYHHCCLFILDYFGITLFAFCSTTAHFFASSELTYYQKVGWYNLVVLMLVCSVGFYFCSFSQTSKGSGSTYHRSFKLWTNAIGYFYGILPIGHRLWTASSNDPAMFYHVMQFVFFVSSPAWYASDIPQRFWPGKFDIVGHSHQIFHVFGALGCYFDILAIHLDVTSGKWQLLHGQVDYPSFATACVVIFLLGVYCLLVGVYFSRKLRDCYQDEIAHCHCKTATFYTGDEGDRETLKKNE